MQHIIKLYYRKGVNDNQLLTVFSVDVNEDELLKATVDCIREMGYDIMRDIIDINLWDDEIFLNKEKEFQYEFGDKRNLINLFCEKIKNEKK